MLVHEAQSAIEANALLSDALARGEHYDISLIDVSTGSQGGPFGKNWSALKTEPPAHSPYSHRLAKSQLWTTKPSRTSTLF